MFMENKYYRCYNNIIEKCKNRIINENIYYENHHIIPKCFGGVNKENLVLLTAKEHYIAHLLLTKCTSGDNKRKMVFALMAMMRSNKYHMRNSYSFSIIRKIISKNISGEKNPFYGKGHFGKQNHFYGKKHTEETKQYISKILKDKMSGEKNPFYGKNHTKISKNKISKKNSIKIKVYFTNGDIKIFKNRRVLGTFLNMSEYLGAKLLNPTFKHLWIKYNIKDIIRYEN